jgi:hypothetical protein
MARNLTTAHKTQLTSKVKRVGLFVEIDYTPTPVRVWTGQGNISWDSKTWVGLGDFGGISVITEKIGIRAGMIKLTLNGVPSANIANALDNAQQNRSVQVWIGTFSESGGVWSVVADPNRIEWGDTDVHEIIEDEGSCTIEVSVETPLSRMQMLSIIRATSEDQHRHFPDDTFFDFAPQVPEKVLYWPTPEPTTTNNTAAGGSSHREATSHQ